jgi:N-acetylglucosaminyldiphosphoundecaprenol N-acetyl-beta-D-mannosaminyltransferase
MEQIATPHKQPVLGIGISTTTYQEVIQVCARWIVGRQDWKQNKSRLDRLPTAKYICVTSVHGVISAFLDKSLRSVWNGADIATPDGMPVVWALRSFGHKAQTRVYGPDLMLAICEQAERLHHRVFLYGGRDDTLTALCNNLKARFPNLVVSGVFSPPFRLLTASEDAACINTIMESDADIVFVGLSTPKQERWMRQHQESLPGIVLVGVGAAFDFHAGRVRQAPSWMQGAGLEWSFRLLMEPRRLWKRYILLTPLFLPLWAMQRMGLLRYENTQTMAPP